MDNKLIDKYWDAETSLEEEARLMSEASGLNTPEAAYFAFIARARHQKSILSMDDIDAYNLKQTLDASKATVRPLYRWMASAAAIMIVLFSAWGVWEYSQQSAQQPQMAESYEDPYEAYEEVKKALAFVSSKLNQSQSEAFAGIQKASEYSDLFK